MAGAVLRGGAAAAGWAWRRLLVPVGKKGLELAKKYGPKAWQATKEAAKKGLQKLKDGWKKLKERFSKQKKKNGCEACANRAKQRAKGKRTKNRLPDGKKGDRGPKNGTLEKRNPQTGELQQRRTYDENGMPKKDIDFDHDHGAGKPHVHDWKYESPQAPHPSRGDGRPPIPGEL